MKVYKGYPTTERATEYDELRCIKCNKLLFTAAQDAAGKIETVCPRCKTRQAVQLDNSQSLGK